MDGWGRAWVEEKNCGERVSGGKGWWGKEWVGEKVSRWEWEGVGGERVGWGEGLDGG